MFLKMTYTRTAAVALLTLGGLAINQSAFAFADDDARKAIVELRQQIKILTEANQRARIQLADQIEALEQEVVRLRGDMEQLGRPSSGPGPLARARPTQNPPIHASSRPLISRLKVFAKVSTKRLPKI